MDENVTDLSSGQSNAEIFSAEPMAEAHEAADPQHSQVKKITWVKALTAILNGLGVGLLLGMLMSLSLSPVVSGVIAALTGLLALLLGMDEKYIDPLKSIRIGSFGLSAVVGIIIGLYIRASNPFAPTMLDQMKSYIEVGYSDEEARAFITKSIESDPDKAKREAGVLYSSTVDAGSCEMLSYASEDQPAEEIVNTFVMAKGTWQEFAETFRKDLPGELVGKSLLTMRDVFCNEASDEKTEMTNLDKVRKISNNDSVEEIETVLQSSGKSWQAIVGKVRETIPEQERKVLYLSIIKVLSHD